MNSVPSYYSGPMFESRRVRAHRPGDIHAPGFGIRGLGFRV